MPYSKDSNTLPSSTARNPVVFATSVPRNLVQPPVSHRMQMRYGDSKLSST